MDLTFQVPVQYCSYTSDLASITSHIHNWVLFFAFTASLHSFFFLRRYSTLNVVIILNFKATSVTCCYGQLVTNLIQSDSSVSFFSICSVQFSPFSGVHLFAMPWTAACQASLSTTKSRSLLKLMSIDLVMPSIHLILSTTSLPAFNLS